MAYGTDGACTRIPTQSDIPGNARVRSYPLRESSAFVWIWMGEPDEIGNHDPPVDLTYTADPDWSVVLGYYEVAANWILIRENVLDLTHIAHLRPARSAGQACGPRRTVVATMPPASRPAVCTTVAMAVPNRLRSRERRYVTCVSRHDTFPP